MKFPMKLLFLGGVALLFISLFLDWYSYRVYDLNNVLIASWDYSILFEWSTDLAYIEMGYKPDDLKVPVILSMLFIILLLCSGNITLFRDFESFSKYEHLRKFSFIIISLLIMVFFYVVLFPILYLFPNDMYFPNLTNYNSFLELKFSYSISYGYILQLIGFVLIFPYSTYYYITISQLEKTEQKIELQTERMITSVQEPIDIDKLLAEEISQQKVGI